MRFYLDTANLAEIKKAIELGVVEGVTTNPSLVAKEGLNMNEAINVITNIVKVPMFVEVTALESEGMITEGEAFASINKDLVIKLPCTWEGIKACKILSDKNIKVAITLIFSANQALIAARAGASYVAPFVGRLNDISQDGVATLIKDIKEIIDMHKLKVEIVAASVRTPIDVLNCAKAGVDIATVPYNTLVSLLKHPLTDSGLEKFMSDWATIENID
ncbi:fructose-6-phosphate aldolase [Alkalibaculum sp. M08DMB]|uniref:Fructose-6-phosphate aldolase n=1 Tax=Alkalibaculum sporogenes TaxID=2655001 RepID=A0A6A7KCM1_9FIRM|nr:fructose-6-phosphate aldolase [Alkalibaculum sporogenes]MPW27279.1 fructose-6-phosphate aldolase [Alkalibaculum sporogenes]